MTKNELMTELDIVIDEARTGILATTGGDGKPHMRWMTPCLLKDRQDTLFAVTSSEFAKAKHLEGKAEAEWMIQTPLLDKVITLRGKINLLANSSIKSEVLEVIGSRLSAFWRLNEKPEELIVLETIIEEAVFFQPMKGYKKEVKFQ